MQSERISPVKILLYTGLLFLIFVLETALPIRLFGFRIDVLPCVALAAALLDGPVEGVFLGLLTGLFYDVSYTGAEGLLSIYYMLCSGLAGFLSQRYLRKMLPSMYLLTACVALPIGLCRYAYSWLEQKPTEALLFFQKLCGETLIMVAFSTIVYGIVRMISRRFAKPEQ